MPKFLTQKPIHVFLPSAFIQQSSYEFLYFCFLFFFFRFYDYHVILRYKFDEHYYTNVLNVVSFVFQIDPFLCLVDDCKLQAVNPGSRQGKIEYGSKEDDNCALGCLSEIEITKDQAREDMVSLIVKSLEDLAKVIPFFLFLLPYN